MNHDDVDVYSFEDDAARVRGLTGTEWARLSWLTGGVGLVLGFALGILVCVVTS